MASSIIYYSPFISSAKSFKRNASELERVHGTQFCQPVTSCWRDLYVRYLAIKEGFPNMCSASRSSRSAFFSAVFSSLIGPEQYPHTSALWWLSSSGTLRDAFSFVFSASSSASLFSTALIAWQSRGDRSHVSVPAFAISLSLFLCSGQVSAIMVYAPNICSGWCSILSS